ncbi:unnamed protein product, partial [Notodromas monacha]
MSTVTEHLSTLESLLDSIYVPVCFAAFAAFAAIWITIFQIPGKGKNIRKEDDVLDHEDCHHGSETSSCLHESHENCDHDCMHHGAGQISDDGDHADISQVEDSGYCNVTEYHRAHQTLVSDGRVRRSVKFSPVTFAEHSIVHGVRAEKLSEENSISQGTMDDISGLQDTISQSQKHPKHRSSRAHRSRKPRSGTPTTTTTNSISTSPKASKNCILNKPYCPIGDVRQSSTDAFEAAGTGASEDHVYYNSDVEPIMLAVAAVDEAVKLSTTAGARTSSGSLRDRAAGSPPEADSSTSRSISRLLSKPVLRSKFSAVPLLGTKAEEKGRFGSWTKLEPVEQSGGIIARRSRHGSDSGSSIIGASYQSGSSSRNRVTFKLDEEQTAVQDFIEDLAKVEHPRRMSETSIKLDNTQAKVSWGYKQKTSKKLDDSRDDENTFSLKREGKAFTPRIEEKELSITPRAAPGSKAVQTEITIPDEYSTPSVGQEFPREERNKTQPLDISRRSQSGSEAEEGGLLHAEAAAPILQLFKTTKKPIIIERLHAPYPLGSLLMYPCPEEGLVFRSNCMYENSHILPLESKAFQEFRNSDSTEKRVRSLQDQDLFDHNDSNDNNNKSPLLLVQHCVSQIHQGQDQIAATTALIEHDPATAEDREDGEHEKSDALRRSRRHKKEDRGCHSVKLVCASCPCGSQQQGCNTTTGHVGDFMQPFCQTQGFPCAEKMADVAHNFHCQLEASRFTLPTPDGFETAKNNILAIVPRDSIEYISEDFKKFEETRSCEPQQDKSQGKDENLEKKEEPRSSFQQFLPLPGEVTPTGSLTTIETSITPSVGNQKPARKVKIVKKIVKPVKSKPEGNNAEATRKPTDEIPATPPASPKSRKFKKIVKVVKQVKASGSSKSAQTKTGEDSLLQTASRSISGQNKETSGKVVGKHLAPRTEQLLTANLIQQQRSTDMQNSSGSLHSEEHEPPKTTAQPHQVPREETDCYLDEAEHYPDDSWEDGQEGKQGYSSVFGRLSHRGYPAEVTSESLTFGTAEGKTESRGKDAQSHNWTESSYSPSRYSNVRDSPSFTSQKKYADRFGPSNEDPLAIQRREGDLFDVVPPSDEYVPTRDDDQALDSSHAMSQNYSKRSPVGETLRKSWLHNSNRCNMKILSGSQQGEIKRRKASAEGEDSTQTSKSVRIKSHSPKIRGTSPEREDNKEKMFSSMFIHSTGVISGKLLKQTFSRKTFGAKALHNGNAGDTSSTLHSIDAQLSAENTKMSMSEDRHSDARALNSHHSSGEKVKNTNSEISAAAEKAPAMILDPGTATNKVFIVEDTVEAVRDSPSFTSQKKYADRFGPSNEDPLAIQRREGDLFDVVPPSDEYVPTRDDDQALDSSHAMSQNYSKRSPVGETLRKSWLHNSNRCNMKILSGSQQGEIKRRKASAEGEDSTQTSKSVRIKSHSPKIRGTSPEREDNKEKMFSSMFIHSTGVISGKLLKQTFSRKTFGAKASHNGNAGDTSSTLHSIDAQLSAENTKMSMSEDRHSDARALNSHHSSGEKVKNTNSEISAAAEKAPAMILDPGTATNKVFIVEDTVEAGPPADPRSTPKTTENSPRDDQQMVSPEVEVLASPKIQETRVSETGIADHYQISSQNDLEAEDGRNRNVSDPALWTPLSDAFSSPENPIALKPEDGMIPSSQLI